MAGTWTSGDEFPGFKRVDTMEKLADCTHATETPCFLIMWLLFKQVSPVKDPNLHLGTFGCDGAELEADTPKLHPKPSALVLRYLIMGPTSPGMVVS